MDDTIPELAFLLASSLSPYISVPIAQDDDVTIKDDVTAASLAPSNPRSKDGARFTLSGLRFRDPKTVFHATFGPSE